MFLEVIVGNDRAISFYRKKGYEKVYNLFYYYHNKTYEISASTPPNLIIKRIDMDALKNLR